MSDISVEYAVVAEESCSWAEVLREVIDKNQEYYRTEDVSLGHAAGDWPDSLWWLALQQYLLCSDEIHWYVVPRIP